MRLINFLANLIRRKWTGVKEGSGWDCSQIIAMVVPCHDRQIVDFLGQHMALERRSSANIDRIISFAKAHCLHCQAFIKPCVMIDYITLEGMVSKRYSFTFAVKQVVESTFAEVEGVQSK